jgi:hypothetical protein
LTSASETSDHQNSHQPWSVVLCRIAKLYALLGDQEKAIGALAKSVEAQEFHVVFLRADPVFDGLRDDLRYADLLRRMNLAT